MSHLPYSTPNVKRNDRKLFEMDVKKSEMATRVPPNNATWRYVNLRNTGPFVSPDKIIVVI